MTSPATVTIDSIAFQRALFRSERPGCAGCCAGGRAGDRGDAGRDRRGPRRARSGLLGIAIFGAAVVFELLSWVVVERTLQAGGARAPMLMAAGPLVETLVPTLALHATAQAHAAGAARALAGPAVVVYYLLDQMLSILRLSPGLSLATGVVAAAGYGIVYEGVARRSPPAPTPRWRGVFAAEAVLLGSPVRSPPRSPLAFEPRRGGAARGGGAAGGRAVPGRARLAQKIQQGCCRRGARRSRFDVAGWNRPADETGGDYSTTSPVLRRALGRGGRRRHRARDRAGARHGRLPRLPARRPDDHAAPGGSVTTTSERLLEDLPRGKFVTLAAVRCTARSAEARAALRRATARCSYRAAEGRSPSSRRTDPARHAPGLPYARSETLELAPGDMLVMLTDGFWEWEGADGEQFGVKRLKAGARRGRRPPAAEVITGSPRRSRRSPPARVRATT